MWFCLLHLSIIKILPLQKNNLRRCHISISLKNIIPKILIIFIIGNAILTFYLSLNRQFNFDEFQVVYASSSILKGQALYKDAIDRHFPFTNLFISFIAALAGEKAATLLIIRVVMFLLLSLTLFLVYNIGTLLKDKSTGLIAVLLTCTSFVFLEKGIEIRHDVFNMLFNTMSIFFILRHYQKNQLRDLILTGLSLGLALASTQKAIIGITGITLGSFIVFSQDEDIQASLKKCVIVLFFSFVPIILCFMALILFFQESYQAILENTILKAFSYILPASVSKGLLEFPYSRWAMYKGLLIKNGILYITSVLYAFFILVKGVKKNDQKIILVFWFLSCLSFYLYMKRPFYQSFLPTVPASALLVGILSTTLFDRVKTKIKRRLTFFVIAGYIAWTQYAIIVMVSIIHNSSLIKSPQCHRSLSNKKQLANVSFCLNNLAENDVVLNFSNNQLFFKPLLTFYYNQCADIITEIESECIVNSIIEKQCKVLICDHRTKALKIGIQKRLLAHYTYSGVGDILIPGTVIKPGEKITFEIWISGKYNLTSKGILINQSVIYDHQIFLEKGHYQIINPTPIPVTLFYHFTN